MSYRYNEDLVGQQPVDNFVREPIQQLALRAVVMGWPRFWGFFDAR